MNATEQLAYDWLLEEGWRPDEITFQYKRSPDFMLADGSGVEVKRPAGHQIIFGWNQAAQLRALGGVIVLIRLGGGFQCVPFDELEIPGYWEGYRVNTAPTAEWVRGHAEADLSKKPR